MGTYTDLKINETGNRIDGDKFAVWSHLALVASETYAVFVANPSYGMGPIRSTCVGSPYLAVLNDIPYLVLEEPFVFSC